MQVHVTLFAIAAILIASIESKPAWSTSYVNSYTYPSEAIAVQSPLLEYQDSPYYFYNVHTDVDTVPTAVLSEEKTLFHQLPAYSFYYKTPVYNLHLSPAFPVLKSGPPLETPKETPPTTTTAKPTEENEKNEENEENEGTIEKLDTKVKPEKKAKEPNETAGSDNNKTDVLDPI